MLNNNEKIKHVFDSKNHAQNYDKKAQKSKWVVPEILFGLSYAFTNPGETLLDLGIGTGLSSVLFQKAGLVIHGMDYSTNMLDICAEKGTIQNYKNHDMLNTPYPYANNSMDHITCAGVFHLFEDLSPIFEETSRILKKEGYFTFSLIDHQDKNYQKITVQDQSIPGKSLSIFCHSENKIRLILEKFGFQHIKDVGFLGMHVNRETHFRAYLVKNENPS